MPSTVSVADAIAIRSGEPLIGTVRVDGSKNAALPLIAAAAAVGRLAHLGNVPQCQDVRTMLDLLRLCGYSVARSQSNPEEVVIMPISRTEPPADLTDAGGIRASYYLVPALLAACGRARLPWPGGCPVGERGMDLHFRVYEKFGDQVLLDSLGYQVIRGKRRATDLTITLPYRSRGATVAAVLRAVIERCRLTVTQPNLSPEVAEILAFLREAGWEASADDETLVLVPLHLGGDAPLAWEVPGDKVEAVTLACAVAISRGSAQIRGVRAADVRPALEAFAWLGIPAHAGADTVTVQGQDTQLTGQPLRAIASLAPDGLDADFEPPLMALALGVPGVHLFADAINPGRHGNLVPQLARLGAVIEQLSATHCRFAGPQRLTGAAVRAGDIRTGSTLIVAALAADGTTTVSGLAQLRRGHADLPGKLRHLGADITEEAA
ncbi:UDP-N-acetylglucosamine 1-carboxyvinyltransferase [Nonomuraea sp. FMUSA5-5]|uniref:UDP-N-acetylglucosamine 1-carboxyvinyltransferase n=1 Tax=Nonomuraea composti TaxID=2720023 RepID=A0ABX1B5P2_9ACTN|nr:UDP-N-acetylglucosamine 1-carboxyvinyltransferase [Nonomuraea sp. FMUSA5-5]NJP91619.1 UDP-N-acetylglucosamine 1-carboxyvinyltransferase [Nonomuraea sp. FMUSA5-5]